MLEGGREPGGRFASLVNTNVLGYECWGRKGCQEIFCHRASMKNVIRNEYWRKEGSKIAFRIILVDKDVKGVTQWRKGPQETTAHQLCSCPTQRVDFRPHGLLRKTSFFTFYYSRPPSTNRKLPHLLLLVDAIEDDAVRRTRPPRLEV